MVELRQARPALGTLVDIRMAAPSAAGARAAMLAAFAAIEQVESVFSAYRPDSECSRLSASAHLKPFQPSPQMASLLRTALALHRDSSGVFDVAAHGAGSSADIEWDAAGQVSFRRPLRLDFGGIAKGCAIDGAIETLRHCGALSAVVNAGGDLRVTGATGEPVALRFADGLRVVARLRDGAFAASRITPAPAADGPVASWSNLPGAHRDGRSGAPVTRTDTIAVFAPTATIADALTKVALVSPAIADRLCARHAAEWRAFPFDLRNAVAASGLSDAA